MTYHTLFGRIAGVLLVLGMLPYLYSIVITEKTKPNRASWTIWMVISIINLLAYKSSGAKETLWFAVVGALNSMTCFLLSIPYGVKNWKRTDTYCFILAMLAISVWKFTGNPVLALALGLVANTLGLIPTFLKVRLDPASENLQSWSLGLVSSICNVFAVSEWTLANFIYTVYMIFGFLLIVVPASKSLRVKKVSV